MTPPVSNQAEPVLALIQSMLPRLIPKQLAILSGAAQHARRHKSLEPHLILCGFMLYIVGSTYCRHCECADSLKEVERFSAAASPSNVLEPIYRGHGQDPRNDCKACLPFPHWHNEAGQSGLAGKPFIADWDLFSLA